MVEPTWALFFDIQEGTLEFPGGHEVSFCILIQWVDAWINGEDCGISQVSLAEFMDFL